MDPPRVRPVPPDPPLVLRRRAAHRGLLPPAGRRPGHCGSAAHHVLPAGGACGVRSRLGVGALGCVAGPCPGGAVAAGGPGGAGVGTRLSSSRLYAHLWGTPELDAVFDERAMLQRWLDILVALARAQASLGIVPVSSAEVRARAARVDALDLDYVAAQTRLSAHSTLGLIRGLLRVLPADVREHVSVGATVLDVSDTC